MHSWWYWHEVDRQYNYVTPDKTYSRILMSTARNEKEAEKTGLICWIFILRSMGVDLPFA